MAVISIKERRDSPRAEFSVTDRVYYRTWDVDTNDDNDGPITVVATPPIPRKGQAFTYGNDYDLGAIVTNVAPRRNPDKIRRWEVVARYSTTTEEEKDEENKSPLDQVVTIRSEKILQLCDVDIDGNAIENAAGDPFDPPAEQEHAIMVFEIRRGETGSLQIDEAQEYLNSINSDDFSIRGVNIDARWAKLDDFTATEAYYEGVFYWDCYYVIKSWPINPGDPHIAIPEFSYWDKYLLEHGPHEIVGGNKVRCKNSDGEYILCNLNKDTGVKLGVNDAPQFSHFKTWLRKPYSAFAFT